MQKSLNFRKNYYNKNKNQSEKKKNGLCVKINFLTGLKKIKWKNNKLSITKVQRKPLITVIFSLMLLNKILKEKACNSIRSLALIYINWLTTS